jgi:redox-sensitive bicupin YhaK (pirin superfamily)
MERMLKQIMKARPSRDGDGVQISRIAGQALSPLLDPFLMIDEIESDSANDYVGGFPEHPHRGFETITYMKAGRMRHRDHMGNEGVIGPGDVQWMTAGRGVLHSEMPEQEEGLMHGFQLWLNLPATEKLKPAAYRDIRASEVSYHQDTKGNEFRIVAGELEVDGLTLAGPLPDMSTQPFMMDLTVAANQSVQLKLPDYDQVLVLVYKGNTETLACKELGFFGEGETLQLTALDAGFEALVLAGKALREPIAQYGPFVMNHMHEIEQAIRDFQSGRLVG